MQLSHVFPVRSMVFDEPNLVSHAGLVPAMAMAGKAGLIELADRHLTVAWRAGPCGRVEGICAGRGDGGGCGLDRGHGGAAARRHGSAVRRGAGTDHFGHVPAGVEVRARPPVGRGRRPVPDRSDRHGGLVDTAAALTYLDMDDTIRRTYGYAKQGSGYGYSGVKGLNALLATVSSADRAPVIVATRLRKGSANSARGAARLVADSLKTTTACGVGGTVILRADSAYYGRRRHRRGPPRRCPLLDHRPQGPRRHCRDRGDPRRQLDEDPLPQSGLRRGTGSVGLRRRSRRDLLHRFRIPGQDRSGQRPADRPAGPRRQPRPRHRRRAGRTVPGLAAPRRVHRLTAADAPGRGRSPPPRDHRTGHRRPEERTVGASAVGQVHGQLRLAGPGRDGVQPDPGGRRRSPAAGTGKQ